MATATGSIKQVMSYSGEVTLTLSAEEAMTLRRVLRRVGGHPHRSQRRHADSVAEALSGVLPADLPDNNTTGSIHFADVTGF